MTTEYMSGSDYGTDKDKGAFEPRISFLYNGQYGVITDDNGLYYMRSRYYNPEIKRFINQDILTGSIGNSASLNRYSYVEGNPVSYTDPFGLSPFAYFTDIFKPFTSVHAVFDALGCIPGPVGTFFDLTNAGLYFAEGEYGKAAESVIFAIPGMDLGGKGTKYILKGTKAGRIAGKVLKGVDFVANVAAACITAQRFGDNVAYMIDTYLVNGEAASWKTVGEVGDLVISGIMLGHYSRGATNSAANLEMNPKDFKGEVITESLIENVTYGGNKVPSSSELPGVTDVISVSNIGGSGINVSDKTYYHVTTAENAQKIIECGELGVRENRWESRVFAWTEQPTKRQASIAGVGKDARTVIRFNTNASFEPDVGNSTKPIANIVVQTTDGQRVPISIKNAEIVGFKKEWWEFWKK